MLNFGSFDTSKTEELLTPTQPILPEGSHRLLLASVKELKSNKSGNLGFCIYFAKDGYRDTMDYINLKNDARSMAKVMNLIMAFGGELQKREYSETELHGMISGFVGREVEAEIYHQDNEYVNKDGETIKGMQARISILKPTEEGETSLEDDIDLGLE